MSAADSGSSAGDLVAMVGLGFLAVALLCARGRKTYVVISGGTGLALLAGAVLIGHAG